MLSNLLKATQPLQWQIPDSKELCLILDLKFYYTEWTDTQDILFAQNHMVIGARIRKHIF